MILKSQKKDGRRKIAPNLLIITSINFSAFNKYIKDASIKDYSDPFDFWNSNLTDDFKELSTVALQILSIPATNSFYENGFSPAGIFEKSKKFGICPTTLNAKLILTANQSILEALDPIVY
jgi:hypothetical protein